MLRDLRLVTIAETFSRVASFVTIPLLTRALLPSEYGLYKSTLLLFSLLLMIRGLLSLGLVIEKRLPEIPQRRQYSLISASVITLVCVLILTLLGFWIIVELSLVAFLSPNLQTFVESHYVLVCFTLTSTPFYRLGLTALRGMDEFGFFSAFTIGREGFFLIAIFGLFLTENINVVTILVMLLLANSVAFTVQVLLFRGWFVSKPDFDALSSQFREISLPLAPRIVFKKARDTVPDAIVLSVFGTGIFGQWSLLFIFVTAFSLVTSPISKVLLPKLSARLSNDQPLDGIVHRYYRLLGILIVPAVIGGWLIGPPLIREIFGQDYYYGFPVTAILITTFGIQSFNTLSGRFFIATDKSIYETYTQMFSAGVLLPIAATGAYIANSLNIVALAFLLEQSMILSFSLLYQSRFVTLSPPSIGVITRILTALAALSGFVLLTRPLINNSVHAVGIILLGGGIYFATLYSSGFFTEDDISIFRRFIGV